MTEPKYHNTAGHPRISTGALTADEYGTVCLSSTEGLEAMTGKTTHLYIPKDCIQNFINALEQFK